MKKLIRILIVLCILCLAIVEIRKYKTEHDDAKGIPSEASEGFSLIGKINDFIQDKMQDVEEHVEPVFTLEGETDSIFNEAEMIYENTDDADLRINISEVNAIQLVCAGVQVVFEEDENAEGFDFHIQNVEKFQAYVKDGVLYISAYNDGIDAEKGKVTVSHPQILQESLQNMKVDAGGSVVKLGALSMEALEISMNAGTLSWDDLRTEELVLKTNAGVMIGRATVVTEKTAVEMTAGSVDITGSIKGTASFGVSAGKLDLHLTGSQQDYNYELSCMGGKILLEEDEIDENKSIDHGKEDLLQLDCNVGVIALDFSAEE